MLVLQFVSTACLGLPLIILSIIGGRRTIHASSSARLVALVLGLLLIASALTAAWRATRMGLRVSGDELRIRGLLTSRSVPLVSINQWGFTQAGLGRALFFITDGDQPYVVRAVSSPAGRTVSAEAEAIPERLQELHFGMQTTPASDPLPALPVVESTFSPTPPPGGVVWRASTDQDTRGAIRSFLFRYVGLGVGIAVYVAALAIAIPNAVWFIVSGSAVLFLVFLVTLVGMPLLLRRTALMLDDVTLARWQLRRGWQTFDLAALRGVGFKRDLSVLGILGTMAVRRSFVLVDDSGRRFDLPLSTLASPAGQALRRCITTAVAVTPSASHHLGNG
jgi:hypothetical protein